MTRGRLVAAIGLCVLPALARAQVTITFVPVVGVAWDSLDHRPLAGAFIGIGGRSAITDSLGVFRIDTAVAGPQRLEMQHDVLDSLGLSSIRRVVELNGRDTVRIAIPSLATMWRNTCGTPAPADSAFAFGVLRDGATRKPVPHLAVTASWIDLRADDRKSVSQKMIQLTTTTDSTGAFALCGLPTTTGWRIEAGDPTGMISVDFPPNARGIAREDLTLTPAGDSVPHAIVEGHVISDGVALSGVRVSMDGLDEVRTDDRGYFVIARVPVGSRQLYVRQVGMAAATRVIDVIPDTTSLLITLGRVTILDSMKTTGISSRALMVRGFNERRNLGLGYFRDSSTLGKFSSLTAMFGDMPAVTVQTAIGGGVMFKMPRCDNPIVIIDRRRVSVDETSFIRPQDIAGIEVYRRGQTPPEFLLIGNKTMDDPITKPRQRPGVTSGGSISPPCSVIIWTKRDWP